MVYDQWYYKMVHLITSSSTLTDYQVSFTVYYGSGTNNNDVVYLNGKCNTDFSDLRFTDLNENILPYWIESKTNGSVAVIWVKINTVNTTSGIILYYNNTAAVSESNGDNVFVFFDDFLGITLDTNKWNADWNYSGSGVISIANSTLTLYANSSSSAGRGLKSTSTFSYPYVLEMKAIMPYNSSGTLYAGWFTSTNTNPTSQNQNVATIVVDKNVCSYLNGNGASSYVSVITQYNNGVSKLKHTIKQNTSGYFDVYISDVLVDSSHAYSYTSSKIIRFAAYCRTLAAGALQVDWVGVRKYSTIEPAHGIWVYNYNQTMLARSGEEWL